MNTDRDRVIAKALGLCWHENLHTELLGKSKGFKFGCSHCGDNDPDRSYGVPINHPFSTADAMLLILKLGPGREWWTPFTDFLRRNDVVYSIDYKDNILQDPNRIANELYKFLNERGGK